MDFYFITFFFLLCKENGLYSSNSEHCSLNVRLLGRQCYVHLLAERLIQFETNQFYCCVTDVRLLFEFIIYVNANYVYDYDRLIDLKLVLK